MLDEKEPDNAVEITTIDCHNNVPTTDSHDQLLSGL